MSDIYRAFYTKSDLIAQYMARMLSLEPGLSILEPCGGDGVFIKALNGKLSGLQIDIYELNSDAVTLLRTKFKANPNIQVIQADTLTDPELTRHANKGGIYDRIIANPPYGAWQEYDRRKCLKKLYNNAYVKETYALFLYRCLQLLKEDGILVFIIPDTYLNLHRYTKLREYLLTHAKIKEITLFPSSFFPGIHFGYSNLSIITLQKCTKREACLENMMTVVTGFKNVEGLDQPREKGLIYQFTQREVLNNLDHALFISPNSVITPLINKAKLRVGDLAACVTGFYSGNDKKYLRSGIIKTKNNRNYTLIDQDLICTESNQVPDLLNGIPGSKCFVPVVKGSGIKYYKPDLWYMNWGMDAVLVYKTDKKARFQNSEYYFKYGIGIPMVSSSQMTAALIENRLFDQSIVGVFLKDAKLFYYLLAFFNSPTCNAIIRVINPSANNSANYIKKIPVIVPSEGILKQIDELMKALIGKLKKGEFPDEEAEKAINQLISEVYGF
jgi:phospholipid N-methyltransferase